MTTRYKARVIRQLIPNACADFLMDIGCGSGFLLHELDPLFSKSVGIDMSIESIRLAGNYTRADLVLANAEKIPFADASFDCIISSDTFEHIPDDANAIREVKRLLRKGGVLILYVPSKNGLLSTTRFVDLYHRSQTSYLMDYRYYTIESVTRLIREAGLTVEYIGYHNVFTQEFFTQLLKAVSFKLGKEYQQQGDITQFINSKFFPVYRWCMLPIIHAMIRIEEFVFEKGFQSKVPGHRIILKCRK